MKINKKRIAVIVLLLPLLIPICLCAGVVHLFTSVIDGIDYALTGEYEQKDNQ